MNKTFYEIVKLVLNSDLPIGTKNRVTCHYLLPHSGYERSPIEMVEDDEGVGGVDRPDADEIELENNPYKKAGEKDTERLMRKV